MLNVGDTRTFKADTVTWLLAKTGDFGGIGKRWCDIDL